MYGHALALVTVWCSCGRPAVLLPEDGEPALCARCALGR